MLKLNSAESLLLGEGKRQRLGWKEGGGVKIAFPEKAKKISSAIFCKNGLGGPTRGSDLNYRCDKKIFKYNF